MPLNAQNLLDFQLGPQRVELTAQGTILYALGAGFGHDPVDQEQLRYVYEKDLRASPYGQKYQSEPISRKTPAF